MKLTRLGRILPTLVTVALLILFVRLGFWQLGRAVTKGQLEQTIQRNRAAAEMPLQLSSVTPDSSSWEYRRVRVTGRFNTSHQYLLDNRIYRGRAGFQVLSGFSAQNQYLLVNRGWIPLGADRNQLPVLSISAGTITLTGRLVPIPEQGPLLGDAGYGASGWPKVVQQLDLGKLRTQLDPGLIAAVLQLDSHNPDCYVCDWVAQRGGMSANRHRAYALQWFSMALALLCLYVYLLIRKPVRDSHASSSDR